MTSHMKYGRPLPMSWVPPWQKYSTKFSFSANMRWRTSVIVALHEKDPFNDPSNYRGLSLQPCLSTIFSSLLNNKITNFTESNNILGEGQAGFRKNYSTIDNLFVVNSVVRQNICTNKSSLFGLCWFQESVWFCSTWESLVEIKKLSC